MSPRTIIEAHIRYVPDPVNAGEARDADVIGKEGSECSVLPHTVANLNSEMHCAHCPTPGLIANHLQ